MYSGATRILLVTLSFAAATLAGAAAATPGPLVGDADEQALLKSLSAKKLIRAREQAEKILRRDRSSMIARWALARVFHDEEANLPRALFHVRLAERRLVALAGDPPREPLARTWHRRFLKEQESLLGEMDRREAQLALIDRHDALYRPRLEHRRIWALMKLHRFDEAMKLARKVALSKSIYRRISGRNGMIAIEMERQRPRDCYRLGLEGIQLTGGRSCILLHNTAEAALAVFRFKEVERLALKAIQAGIKDCPNSSYPHLARLYLLRGDFQRAMEAVRAARQQGIRKRYRQQFESENTGWLFRLLYVLGKFDKVFELGQRILRTPDRVGMTSLSKELTRLAYILDYHVALQAHMETLRERASARTLSHRVKIWFQLRALDQRAWRARRQAARLMAGRKIKLEDLVRPYFTPLEPWNAGAIIRVAGEGVVLEALRKARSREQLGKKTRPYFDALEGEVAYRRRELDRALSLARAALADLPRDEVLLRGRVNAWAADAARRRGKDREANRYFYDALQAYPTVLRVLGIKLPARILSDAGPLPRKIAKALTRSRRLLAGKRGFVVRVSGKKAKIRICLESAAGRRIACADSALPTEGADDDRVALAIDAFHDKAFAPKIDLTQRDINSLDGSAVRGDADQLIDKVLGK